MVVVVFGGGGGGGVWWWCLMCILVLVSQDLGLHAGCLILPGVFVVFFVFFCFFFKHFLFLFSPSLYEVHRFLELSDFDQDVLQEAGLDEDGRCCVSTLKD